LYIEHDPQMHYLALDENERAPFRKVALFDLVVNNADRKSGHLLFGEDGRWWAIDQALCFNTMPKLRTVIWDFIGEPFSEEEVTALRRLELALQPNAELSQSLGELLREDEIAAMRRRLQVLLRQGVFPSLNPVTALSPGRLFEGFFAPPSMNADPQRTSWAEMGKDCQGNLEMSYSVDKVFSTALPCIFFP